MKQVEIAKELHVTEQTICNWKKNPDFMQELQSGLAMKINYLAPKALKTQEKLLNARSEMVRYTTSKDILDRSGFKPQDKIQVDLTVPVFTGDDDLED